MAEKQDKTGKRGVPNGKRATTGRIVLVGTYKGDQLTKWRGWYNYPVSNDDFNRAEHVEHADAQAHSPIAPRPLKAIHPDTNAINGDVSLKAA